MHFRERKRGIYTDDVQIPEALHLNLNGLAYMAGVYVLLSDSRRDSTHSSDISVTYSTYASALIPLIIYHWVIPASIQSTT